MYLAIKGDVFDVSAKRYIYGPGGSYSFFAGRDASRAYVTGCFKEHLTHDVRGLTDAQLKVRFNADRRACLPPPQRSPSKRALVRPPVLTEPARDSFL